MPVIVRVCRDRGGRRCEGSRSCQSSLNAVHV
jgi:hypothetical protein